MGLSILGGDCWLTNGQGRSAGQDGFPLREVAVRPDEQRRWSDSMR